MTEKIKPISVIANEFNLSTSTGRFSCSNPKDSDNDIKEKFESMLKDAQLLLDYKEEV